VLLATIGLCFCHYNWADYALGFQSTTYTLPRIVEDSCRLRYGIVARALSGLANDIDLIVGV
jgi:hypothetical protein